LFCPLQELYDNIIKLFAQLPLAALVEGNTLSCMAACSGHPQLMLRGSRCMTS
jgi:hypothetical protein